ncbi:hypothetical protein [Methylobacterium oryzihabitans]|uniref:Uncharacterized protein n=1 Tax=Methylobacterium oryzihabitans TaxID=2499852 RepID=A0A437P3Z7_9HYPH|nr:hypothetical protein [Methylobacterium oryzihabitans]RVU16858.1 hypothetical protein EOE48_15450 [Methylobacterium oryzihabitans]
MRFTHLAAALVAGALTFPAAAQTTDPAPPAGGMTEPGSTGSVGGVDRNITGVGQTKPPGSALGPGDGTTPELRRKSREIDRKIDTGICIGCN